MWYSLYCSKWPKKPGNIHTEEAEQENSNFFLCKKLLETSAQRDFVVPFNLHSNCKGETTLKFGSDLKKNIQHVHLWYDADKRLGLKSVSVASLNLKSAPVALRHE